MRRRNVGFKFSSLEKERTMSNAYFGFKKRHALVNKLAEVEEQPHLEVLP